MLFRSVLHHQQQSSPRSTYTWSFTAVAGKPAAAADPCRRRTMTQKPAAAADPCRRRTMTKTPAAAANPCCRRTKPKTLRQKQNREFFAPTAFRLHRPLLSRPRLHHNRLLRHRQQGLRLQQLIGNNSSHQRPHRHLRPRHSRCDCGREERRDDDDGEEEATETREFKIGRASCRERV